MQDLSGKKIGRKNHRDRTKKIFFFYIKHLKKITKIYEIYRTVQIPEQLLRTYVYVICLGKILN